MCIRDRATTAECQDLTGKDKWSKRAVDEMLSNEKFTGNVILLKKSLYSERLSLIHIWLSMLG